MKFQKGDRITFKNVRSPGLHRFHRGGRIVSKNPTKHGRKLYYTVLVSNSGGLRLNLLASQMVLN